MNRDYIYSNSYNPSNYPTNQPPTSRQDIQLYSTQHKKQSENDLHIFNGERPVQDIYSQQDKNFKSNLAFVPQRINKNPSQKAFPIIYNTYNDGGPIQPHIKFQNIGLNPSKPPRNLFNQNDAFAENNHSNLSQKQQHFHQYRYEQILQGNNEFHTFPRIPHENEPQTAKFLQIPDKLNSQTYFLSSQTEAYRPPPQINFENRHLPPVYSVQSHNPPAQQPIIMPQIKHESRVLQRPVIPISPTNRIVIQQPQRLQPSYLQEKPKLITVPQEQYQRYLEHLSSCRKAQQQNMFYKSKVDQLQQKQQFYWQQNKRLRDLVNHFQKRQKQLLNERQQQKRNFDQQILIYRDSTLEEFRLLIQRYKLEMQKKK